MKLPLIRKNLTPQQVEEKKQQLELFLAKARELLAFVQSLEEPCKGEDGFQLEEGNSRPTPSPKRRFKTVAQAYFEALGPLLDSEVHTYWMEGSPLSYADMIGYLGEMTVWLGSDMSADSSRIHHGLFDFVYNRTLYYTNREHKRFFPTVVMLNTPIAFVLELAKVYRPYLIPYIKNLVPSLHHA